MKKLGKTFKLQKELLKTEMNHDEYDENIYMNKKDEWFDYVKNGVSCTAFSYARYSKAMEDITGFSMKDCLSAPGLRWKFFNSLRTEEDERIYTYNDKYIIWFVRQSMKRGGVYAFNQYNESKICDDFLKIISEESNVKGNIYDIIEAYLNYMKKNFKIFEKEYENQFKGYRDEDVKEKEKLIKEKLGHLSIHHFKKLIKLDELLWDFDAVSLYPSMWDENSICP